MTSGKTEGVRRGHKKAPTCGGAGAVGLLLCNKPLAVDFE